MRFCAGCCVKTWSPIRLCDGAFFNFSLVLNGPSKTYRIFWVFSKILLLCQLWYDFKNFIFNYTVCFEPFRVLISYPNVWAAPFNFKYTIRPWYLHTCKRPFKVTFRTKMSFFRVFSVFLHLFIHFYQFFPSSKT